MHQFGDDKLLEVNRWNFKQLSSLKEKIIVLFTRITLK